MKNKTVMNLSVLLLVACLSLGFTFGQTKATEKKAAPPAEKKADVLDINSASKQELMTLPGIGDAYSQKIVDNRPYRAKNELVQKNIIPQATYDKIADRIIAKQNSASSGKKAEPAKKN